jgi:hypothetical protein
MLFFFNLNANCLIFSTVILYHLIWWYCSEKTTAKFDDDKGPCLDRCMGPACPSCRKFVKRFLFFRIPGFKMLIYNWIFSCLFLYFKINFKKINFFYFFLYSKLIFCLFSDHFNVLISKIIFKNKKILF